MASVIAPPAAAPVGLDEAKAYLRVDGDDEDALIAGLVRAATSLCEGFTGLALIAREVSETIPVAGIMLGFAADPGPVVPSSAWRRLSVSPVRAIDGVQGLPADGPGFALAPGAYAIDIDANGDGWVRILQPGSAARATVSYSAGMAEDWNGLPEALRQGVIRLVAHLYAHRDDGDGGAEPPAAVAALWRPWRRMRLA